MLNEWKEYLDYTDPMSYTSASKNDSAWRGRFSFEALEKQLGLNRILTIIARRYLFHDDNGAILSDDPRTRLDYAYRALCAWCSVPDDEDPQREDWEHRTDFRELHEEFPSLVDADGRGWFCRHYLAVMDFAATHPDLVRKKYASIALQLKDSFKETWRKKVVQFQQSFYNSTTDASWLTHFEDVLGTALVLGPLRSAEISLPKELKAKVQPFLPNDLPEDVMYLLIAYYIQNKPDDSDWCVLPAINFDCYYGNSNFSHTYLKRIPEEIMLRDSHYGISRYMVHAEFLP